MSLAVAQNAPEADTALEVSLEDHARQADLHVGSQIRHRRVINGLSQQQLAALIGVTYQQAHKYERGLNRVSAGRLFQIATVLGVSISWFFEGLAEAVPLVEATPRQRMGLELLRNFTLIENERHQEALCQMARVLAGQAAREGAVWGKPGAAPQ